ncbi:hypothetical protein CBL_05292 [Carabus blaptoides fortunei]
MSTSTLSLVPEQLQTPHRWGDPKLEICSEANDRVKHLNQLKFSVKHSDQEFLKRTGLSWLSTKQTSGQLQRAAPLPALDTAHEDVFVELTEVVISITELL